MQFGNFQNITSDHKSRNARAGSYDFLFIILSTKLLKRATFYRVVRARIPSVLGLISFSRPCLPNIQPGLCSFQRVFVFRIFFKLLNDVLV